jgi:hypothetical protein
MAPADAPVYGMQLGPPRGMAGGNAQRGVGAPIVRAVGGIMERGMGHARRARVNSEAAGQ